MGETTCSVPGCGRRVAYCGLCNGHNQRRKKFGDVQADRPLREIRLAVPPGTVCGVEGCERTDIEARGWCVIHYDRWLSHGSFENMRNRVPRKRKPKIPCSVDGCDRFGVRKNDGRCPVHQARWKRTGVVGVGAIQVFGRHVPGQPCSVVGCDSVPMSRGWCVKHWCRWRKYGDPLVLVQRERTGSRTCSWCLRTPDQVPFHRATASPDGWVSTCKWCSKARQQLYFGTKSSADPIILRKNQRTQRWRERNPERVRESGRRWREANRDYMIARVQLRRRRLAGRIGHVPVLNRRHVWQALHGLCGLCALPVPFESMHMDHIKPVARGGSHSYTNVQPTHPHCNQRKSSREVAPWAFATPEDRRRAERLLRKSPRLGRKSSDATTPSNSCANPLLI